jgi:hypothetical protein
MDDTEESFKDKWWERVFANFRAEEAAAAAAQRAPRLVASNQLPEPTDEQAEALRKIFARAKFDLRFRVISPSSATKQESP